MDETALVGRARDGDRDACARLFTEAFPTVRAWMCGILGDPVEADDLAQQTFLRAYERMGQLRDPARFWPWLRAVARSVARNRLRRRSPPAPRLERVVSDPAADAARDEECRTVRRALRRLSRKDRHALWFRASRRGFSSGPMPTRRGPPGSRSTGGGRGRSTRPLRRSRAFRSIGSWTSSGARWTWTRGGGRPGRLPGTIASRAMPTASCVSPCRTRS